MRAGSRLRQRDGRIAFQRRVVVDVTGLGEQTAVPVVGVLVETQVGHHDRRVADLGDDVAQRLLRDAVRVVGG